MEEEDDVDEQLVDVSDEYVEEFQEDVNRGNVLNEDDINNVLSYEKLEEFEPNTRGNFPRDDIHNDMIENGNIDDDVDMTNPFNINSKPDDTNVELDEE